jgi:branched-chain amino acid transport system permease protein
VAVWPDSRGLAPTAVAEGRRTLSPRELWGQLGLPLAAAGLLAVPFVGTPTFTATLLNEALIYAIWALSLDLLVGFTGLVSFGHAAGFGLATYAAGYFAREVSADFLLTLVVAEGVVVAVALVAGFIATRVSGVAFAIISLAVCQVLFQIAVGWRSVTQGMDGLVGVPLPRLFGRAIAMGPGFYTLSAVLLVASYLALRWLVGSPFGRTLAAIRSSELRAAAVGIDVRLHKWVAVVISWAVAGVAGTLFVFMKAGTTPMVLHWSESGNVLAMTIFGGLGTLLGPVVGAVAFVFLRDELTTHAQAWQFAFGLVFVLVVILFPNGLAGVLGRLWSRS